MKICIYTITHKQILLLEPMAWLSVCTSLSEPVHNLVLVNTERFCWHVTLGIKVFGLCPSSDTFHKTRCFGNCTSLPSGKVFVFQRLLSRAFVTGFFFNICRWIQVVSETLHSVEKTKRLTNFTNPLILTLSNIFTRATRCSCNLSRTILDKLREPVNTESICLLPDCSLYSGKHL